MQDMIIVDNSITAFKDHLDNGIYVPTFNGNSKDR